jgi:ACS family tartrate transporter-like MFS transporter
MITWGLLAAAMMFVRTPVQFYAVRFLLGVAEAGFFPGVIYYLTHWFPAEARGRAITRFYVASPLSTVVMGALAGSLLGLQGRLGLAGWQWLFLLEGLPAVFMGVAILFLLPDSPSAATWLSTGEKAWIEQKLAGDLAAPDRHPDHGILRAVVNPIVLAFALVNVVALGSYYAFNLSAPQILGLATHLDIARIGYLVAIGGLMGAITMILIGWSSDRWRERFWHLAIPLLASAVAYAVLGVATDPILVVGAYWLAIVGNFGIAATVWLAPSDVLAPRSMAISVAAINSIGQLGSFVSPFLWGLAKDATGSFHLGVSLLPVGYVLAALLVLWLSRQAREPSRRRTALDAA